MTRVTITVDLTKIDAKQKQKIEMSLVGRGRFTVDSASETEEIFSLVVPENHPISEEVADRIIRRFQHILGPEAVVSKISS